MATDRRLKEIVDLLREATEMERISWEKTPDSQEFKGKFNGGGVRVRVNTTSLLRMKEFGSATVAGAGVHPCILTLLEPNGQTIEEWKPTTPEEINAIEGLFGVARRSALDIDEKLNSVLANLRELTGHK